MLFVIKEIIMPPKPKVTKLNILEAAFQLTREQGLESVNARDVAAVLGCSTQPIFRLYASMAELKEDLYEYIQDYYYQFLLASKKSKHFFFNVGLAYIDFAKQETNLYQAIFMSNNFKVTNLREFIADRRNKPILTRMTETIGIDLEKAKQLFLNMWIYTHGIASMLATNSLDLTNEEIEDMLSIAFLSFLKSAQEGVTHCEHPDTI